MKTTKLAGVAIWIWGLGLVVLLVATGTMLGRERQPLELVKAELWKSGGRYEVRGVLHNPRKDAVRDVRVEFDVRTLARATKKPQMVVRGQATAAMSYLPAGASVEFTAASDVNGTFYGANISEGRIVCGEDD